MKSKKYEVEVGGQKLEAEFTDLAENADGSVMLRLGDTVVLATAVMSKGEKEGDYFPLSVEFEERFYAAGQILGSRFIRREGRPSDEAILSGRIIDRTIRPLFNQSMRYDVQVVVTTISLGEYDPDVLGVIAASLALGTSSIPWNGPVGAVRIGRLKNGGEFLVNPNYELRKKEEYELDVIACGRDGTINMIEVTGQEVSEEVLVKALEKAVEELNKIQKFQEDIIKEIGKKKKEVKEKEIPVELKNFFDTEIIPKLPSIIGEAGKKKIYEIEEWMFETLAQMLPDINKNIARQMFHEAVNDFVHKVTLEDGKRVDGRGFDDLRGLYAKAGGISPMLHGSGIFYRGGTHIFSALTLGAPGDSQVIDGMESKIDKRFMHHYNFPPFSVGETGRVGGFNRRMIGHGALAEKALVPVIPLADKFPYTIRLVSETMSSNGSSSMGSVCASTIALMDGGVPITRPVAGIASGVMIKGDKYALLTDIQGPEDEFGDMDFKVAGTTEGVTAIQMDVKVDGIPVKVLGEALEKARLARLQILSVMTAEIANPRATISPRAPQIISLQILPEQIGLVIGGGGKTINGIKADTGVEEIAIEDDGRVYITGKNGTAEAAAERIKALTKRYSVGDRVDAIITKLATFGAFAKLDTYNEGLIHISEIAPFRIEQVEGVLTVGETVPVVVSKVEDGKIGLSIKQADPEFASKRGLEKPE